VFELTEYIFKRKEGEEVSSDIAKLMNLITDKYDRDWVLFLNNGEIISNRDLKKVLEDYGKRKDVKIVLLVKAPSKSGSMFR